MKKLVVFAAMAFCATARCQLFVSSGSQVFVKGRALYVGREIDLQGGGNIYLRNESQLLQGGSGASANRGTGNLSVFQEGTSDNFDYNYWSSPIGKPSSTAGNGDFGLEMLYRPTGPVTGQQAVALPYGNLDGAALPLQVAARWIYKFTASAGYAGWVYVGGSTSVGPGQGFTMKGSAGTDATDAEGNSLANNPGSSQRYDFRGRPNDGDIAVPLAAGSSTLSGNPYPSALNVSAFLLDPANAAGTGIAYYWEQDRSVNSHFLDQYRGGYGAFSPMTLASPGIYVPATYNSYNPDGSLNTYGSSSGLVIERKFAPIGQGFMLAGASAGTVTLKNAHRAYYAESGPLSQFERSESLSAPEPIAGEAIPHIKINSILAGQFTRQLALAFLPDATDGIDRGIDARSLSGDLPTDAYFFLGGEAFVIQGMPFDPGKRIPLGVSTSQPATVAFYVLESVNFDDSQPVYLFDALDGSYHDIKAGAYEVFLEPGTHNSRFEITFTEGILGNADHEHSGFAVSQDPDRGILKISNPDLAQLASIALYDVSGRLVYLLKDPALNRSYEIDTDAFSEGVYVLRALTSSNQAFTRKVIVD